MDGFHGDFFLAGEAHGNSFRSTAYRAADVQFDIQTAAAREDERSQCGKPGVHLVDFVLELLDLGASDARLLRVDIFRLCCKYGAEVE